MEGMDLRIPKLIMKGSWGKEEEKTTTGKVEDRSGNGYRHVEDNNIDKIEKDSNRWKIITNEAMLIFSL